MRRRRRGVSIGPPRANVAMTRGPRPRGPRARSAQTRRPSERRGVLRSLADREAPSAPRLERPARIESPPRERQVGPTAAHVVPAAPGRTSAAPVTLEGPVTLGAPVTNEASVVSDQSDPTDDQVTPLRRAGATQPEVPVPVRAAATRAPRHRSALKNDNATPRANTPARRVGAGSPARVR